MSQFESIDKVLKKGRLELQEVKKKFQKPEDPWGDDTVKTETNNTSSGNASSGGKSKGSGSRTTTVGGGTPKTETPKTETLSKYEKFRIKHKKERKQVIQKITQYGLKPDSR